MKLRIGVIMYQTSRSKGQELVAQRMVAYFRRVGHEAYLITSVYHDGNETVDENTIGENGYVLANDAELGIPIIRTGSFTSKWPPRRIAFKDIVHILERIVNNFQLNVLITHSTLWNGPEEVAKFVEWRRNIKDLGGPQPSLVFCHMSHFQEPSGRRYSLVERSFRMAWNRLSLRTILRVANLILVVTPYEQEAKMKMGAGREKCILFPGGVDDNEFLSYASSDPGELLQRLRVPAGSKIIAYLGTIEDRKNPLAVLDVAAKLADRKEVFFVMAGSGEAEYADQVKQRADALPNVIYLGQVGEKEKVQLIEVSYLNILLSRMEALGLSQLEFMFKGVPVVTSGIGGQSWVVRDGQEGMHVKGPGDIDGAARAISELVDNKTKWQQLSGNARKRASEFTLTKLIRTLDDAITKELERETGLTELPEETRSTIGEPELIVRTWSHGSEKIVASEKRVFIQQGRVSRSTLEIPYSSINSIEHVRKYRWTALVIGAVLAILLFTQHYVFPIVTRSLTSRMVSMATNLAPNFSTQLLQVFANLWLIPVFIGLLVFAVRLRKGYALHGAKLEPVFLSPSFAEAVEFIRDRQDKARGDYSEDIVSKSEEGPALSGTE